MSDAFLAERDAHFVRDAGFAYDARLRRVCGTHRITYHLFAYITGDGLSAIIKQEDFQWIWGCLCGFTKDITREEVLKYPLPSAENYNGYYLNPVSLQHPLSSVEIVPSDSSWPLVISKDKAITDSYLKSYP